LRLSQATPPTPGQDEKRPVVLPLALALFERGGGKLPLQSADLSEEERARGLVVLHENERALRFVGLDAAPTVSLLRGFSAPVRLEPSPSDAELLRLLAHDDDSFNRWQAAQSLALRSIFARLKGERPDDSAFAAALGSVLEGAQSDPAFAALAVTLPSESDLAREQGENVDPDALFSARKELRRELGAALSEVLHKTFEAVADRGPYMPDAASAGRRSVRNAALDLLAAGDPTLGTQLAAAHFDGARNMTDRLAALATLALLGGEAREAAFANFYEMFRNDNLVVDKWFSLQAMIPEPETTARVRALMAHPDFSLANPNRARALVGAFAAGNPTRFHAADGSGYALLTDVVAEIDPKNPQLAARLLASLRAWRTLEATRRAHAEAALRRVAATPGLSGDTADIATRALA